MLGNELRNLEARSHKRQKKKVRPSNDKDQAVRKNISIWKYTNPGKQNVRCHTQAHSKKTLFSNIRK